jgi:outer membrane protein TolC
MKATMKRTGPRRPGPDNPHRSRAAASARRLARLLAISTAAMLAVLLAPALARAQVSLTTVVELAQKNSAAVKLADADVAKARAQLSESRDAFVPSISFGSGLPAFPEIGYTGNLPTLWDATVQSVVLSLPQLRYVQAARLGLKAAQLNQAQARDQVALDASEAYIEFDTVITELDAGRQQEDYASKLVDIERKRTEAGVDPLTQLLQAQLTAAQLKLKRIHLETRAATLAQQLAALTGLPLNSITPDHASIPEIPAVTGDAPRHSTPALDAADMQADSRARAARGDEERVWFPEIAFGALYNRNTTLLNNVQEYLNTKKPLPHNNFSSGFNINLPLLDFGVRAKARESAAEALRARAEAEQARQQNDLEIAQLNGTLRELDAQAEVASLKSQLAAEQLKTVLAQMEFGNGQGNGPGAAPQTTPAAEQSARIDERQKYIESLDASIDLAKARLNLLHALGLMQNWLNELHTR